MPHFPKKTLDLPKDGGSSSSQTTKRPTTKGEPMATKPSPIQTKLLTLEHDFEIKTATFQNPRVDKETGKKGVSEDYALFIDGALFENKFTRGRAQTEALKPLRLATLKEFAQAFEENITESNASFLITKVNNFKDLAEVLIYNKIAFLDFLEWVDEHLPEEEKPGNATPTVRVSQDSTILAGILNGLADMEAENNGNLTEKDWKPDVEKRLQRLLELVGNEKTTTDAIKYLTEKLEDKEYGWVGYEQKTKADPKDPNRRIPNPFYGQIKLRKAKK
jgi:hypothetical protein